MEKYVSEFKDAKENFPMNDYEERYAILKKRYVSKSDMEHLKESQPWLIYIESMKKQKMLRNLLIKLLVFTRD